MRTGQWTLLGTLLGAGVVFFASWGAAQEKGTLVVASAGGAYQEAQRKAFFEPFGAKFGIKIVEQGPADYGRIKAMVLGKNVEWDVVDVETERVPWLAKQGLLEPLDYSVISKKDLLPEAVSEYGIISNFVSYVLAYSTKRFPPGQAPRSWADFWDVTKFPGSRALWKDPISSLTVALMADGVAPQQLYPLDVDRAFRSLDKIKPHVSVWYETGAQQVQLVTSGEVALLLGWNGRIASVQKEGASVAYVWDQGILASASFVVPKGAPNKQTAMKFIAFAVGPEEQAKFATHIPYGPTNTKAFAFLDPKLAAQLPSAPENRSKQVLVDAAWWADNYDKVNERFQAWLIKK
jgi:putative spermidine/putrescine transport system substrate-binding protein